MTNGIDMCDKTLSFIEKAKKIHADRFSYEKSVYVNCNEKITITCKKHGSFEQFPRGHLRGDSCMKCTNDAKRAGTSDFVKRAKLVHGNKYKYGKVYYKNAKSKVIIVCVEHGDFEQAAENHLRGKGCPVCRESKGERLVGSLLKSRGLYFETQYTFDDCCSSKKSPLKFDFYVESLNLLIEFDGEQHFHQIKVFGGYEKFKKQKENDKLKNEYCIENNISLLRIKYNENILSAVERVLDNIKNNGVSHIFYSKNIINRNIKIAA